MFLSRSNGPLIPLFVGGKEAFCERLAMIGNPPPIMGTLDRISLARAGFDVTIRPDAAVVAGQAFTSGVIPLDSFERAAIPTRMRPGVGCDRAVLDTAHGDPLGATAKAPLQRLKAALANDVQDAFWYDHDRHRTLGQLASDFDLPAEGHRPTRQMNPRILEQELTAKAQSVWLSIAHEWLSPVDLRRAMADYDHWRTLNSIV